MSVNVTLTLGANVSGENIQEGNVAPISIPITNSPNTNYNTSTTSGLTTILVPQVPTPATWMRIVPPTASSISKYLMASAGDAVGYQISTTGETWVTVGPGMTSFILRATGTESIKVFFW